MKSRPFTGAREFVHTLGLKTSKDWIEYCKSGEKPEDIPANPDAAYENQFKSMGALCYSSQSQKVDRNP